MQEEAVEILIASLSRLIRAVVCPVEPSPSCKTCRVKASSGGKWPTADKLVCSMEDCGETVRSKCLLARSNMAVVWLATLESRELVVKRFAKDLEEADVNRELEANLQLEATRAVEGLTGAPMTHIFTQASGRTVGIATQKLFALSVMNPPSAGKAQQALNHSIAQELKCNGRLAARSLATVLSTLLEDMQRLHGCGRFMCDLKASNVVFRLEECSRPRSFLIDLGAAIGKESVMIDALAAFGRTMSGMMSPPTAMDVLCAVPGLTPGFCVKEWLDRCIPTAAGECWRRLSDSTCSDEAMEHMEAYGSRVESCLLHNDAFAFTMTALWCVTQQVFYERGPHTGELSLGQIIAQQVLSPECEGFQSWNNLPKKAQLLSTDGGDAVGLPMEFCQFIAQRTSFANFAKEFDPDAFQREVAVVVNALHRAGDDLLQNYNCCT